MSTREIYQTAFDEDVSTNSSATETCPECDGRVQTNARETACRECGLVITAQELDHGPQRFDDESQKRTGAPRTVARHDRELSTKIGTDRDRKDRTLSTGKRRQLRRLRREHPRGSVR